MITASKALDALKRAGLVWDWKRTRKDESWDSDGSLMVTSYDVKSKSLNVSDETFGKKSYLFFYCQAEGVGREAAKILRNAGGQPDFAWGGGGYTRFSLRVSYFKGSRHWE
jgi:rhodanese-related sulfurtransferase